LQNLQRRTRSRNGSAQSVKLLTRNAGRTIVVLPYDFVGQLNSFGARRIASDEMLGGVIEFGLLFLPFPMSHGDEQPLGSRPARCRRVTSMGTQRVVARTTATRDATEDFRQSFSSMFGLLFESWPTTTELVPEACDTHRKCGALHAPYNGGISRLARNLPRRETIISTKTAGKSGTAPLRA